MKRIFSDDVIVIVYIEISSDTETMWNFLTLSKYKHWQELISYQYDIFFFFYFFWIYKKITST